MLSSSPYTSTAGSRYPGGGALRYDVVVCQFIYGLREGTHTFAAVVFKGTDWRHSHASCAGIFGTAVAVAAATIRLTLAQGSLAVLEVAAGTVLWCEYRVW